MATTKKSTRLKEPVKVRTKKLADGSESYYLDIYVDGKRSYEFLKLYLLPEINPMVKEQNRATKAAVEAIKSKRIIELTHSKAGLKKTSVRSKMLLDDWMEAYLAEQERKGARGLKLLRTVCRLLPLYKKKVKMREIDKDWCLGFIDWIQHTYKTRWDKPLSPKCSGLRGLFLHRTQRRRPCRGYPGEPDNDTCSHRTYQGAGIQTGIPDH